MEKRITPKDTYIYDILFNEKVCRWNKSDIKYHIDYSQLGSFIDKDEYTKKIKESFNVWEEALNGKLHFEQTMQNENADITICFRRNNGIGVIGLCEYKSFTPQGEIKRINIKIGLINANRVPATIIHEIGHAIGLMNHSPNKDDIMYYQKEKKVTTLSSKDIATIKLLYSLEVGTTKTQIEAITKKAALLPTPKTQKTFIPQNNRNLTEENKRIADARLIEFNQQYIEINNIAVNYIKNLSSKKSYNF